MYHFFKTWILHRGGNGDQRNCLTGEGQKIGGRDSIWRQEFFKSGFTMYYHSLFIFKWADISICSTDTVEKFEGLNDS